MSVQPLDFIFSFHRLAFVSQWLRAELPMFSDHIFATVDLTFLRMHSHDRQVDEVPEVPLPLALPLLFLDAEDDAPADDAV